MYEFRDTNEYAYPAEVSLQTIVNGVNLDTAIKGFTTLSVHGRELLGKNVETTEFRKIKVGQKTRTYVQRNKSKSQGSSFLGSRMPTRSIKIEYSLKAKSNTEFREQFELLNYYLDLEEAEFIFTDDLKFKWVATLAAVDEVEGNGNWVKGSFEVTCSDSFKMARDEEVFSFSDRGAFKKNTFYPVRLERAEINLKTPISKILLKNETSGQRIILDGDFLSGQKIILNFLDGSIRSGTNQDFIKALDITSDFEDFTILYNDLISINALADVSFYFREVRL